MPKQTAKPHVREFIKAAKREGHEVLSYCNRDGHIQMDIRLTNGRCVDLRMSGTPTCAKNTVDNSLKDLRRMERGIYDSRAAQGKYEFANTAKESKQGRSSGREW